MNVHPIRKKAKATAGTRVKRTPERALQVRLAAFGALIALGTALVFAAGGAYFFYEYGRVAAEMGYPEGHRIFRFFAEQRGNLAGVFAVSTIVSLLLAAVGCAAASRAVASSLHRLNGKTNETADARTEERGRKAA